MRNFLAVGLISGILSALLVVLLLRVGGSPTAKADIGGGDYSHLHVSITLGGFSVFNSKTGQLMIHETTSNRGRLTGTKVQTLQLNSDGTESTVK